MPEGAGSTYCPLIGANDAVLSDRGVDGVGGGPKRALVEADVGVSGAGQDAESWAIAREAADQIPSLILAYSRGPASWGAARFPW